MNNYHLRRLLISVEQLQDFSKLRKNTFIQKRTSLISIVGKSSAIVLAHFEYQVMVKSYFCERQTNTYVQTDG